MLLSEPASLAPVITPVSKPTNELLNSSNPVQETVTEGEQQDQQVSHHIIRGS